jgi:hypothetical protein
MCSSWLKKVGSNADFLDGQVSNNLDRELTIFPSCVPASFSRSSVPGGCYNVGGFAPRNKHACDGDISVTDPNKS